MQTTNVNLKAMTIKEAPNYSSDTTTLKMTNVIVVEKGMASGKPSVDIQLIDNNGRTFLVAMGAELLHSIGVFAGAQVEKVQDK